MSNGLEFLSKSVIGTMMRKAYDMAKSGQITPLERPMDESGERPMDEEEYTSVFRHECDYLKQDKSFLSKEHLEQELARLFKLRHKLKELHHEGTILSLGIFPTTDIGSDLTSQDIKEGKYLQRLEVSAETGATSSKISMIFGPYFQVLPKDRQDSCSMPVHYSQGQDPIYIPDDDYGRIYNFCIDAFNSWRDFFGMEPIGEEEVPRYPLSEAA